MKLATLVPEAWKKRLARELSSDDFTKLEAFVADERRRANVFPPEEQTFAALEPRAPDEIKAVIVGQDPYPTKGNANGLAFSVAPGVKIPASLRNVFAALKDELAITSTSGDLTPWANEGVLLLNTVLTVREGESASHKKRGWEPVTTAILRAVNDTRGPVVFLALGNHAQAMARELVDVKKHHVLELPHPSPLNGRAFVDAAKALRPFSRTNELLREGGRKPIDWKI